MATYAFKHKSGNIVQFYMNDCGNPALTLPPFKDDYGVWSTNDKKFIDKILASETKDADIASWNEPYVDCLEELINDCTVVEL